MSTVFDNLAATRTYATGALTTQREYRIAAPTYAFVGASTIATAVTFDISGILWPGTAGGTLVFKNQKDRRDTLMVSTAGIAYRP